MNQTNPEKPSLILMLAPMAIVLLGYYYLFFMKLNSDLSKAGKQQASLQQQTQSIGQDQSTMDSRLQVVKNDLAKAKKKTVAADAELALAIGEKAKLRSFILGQTGSPKVPNEKKLGTIAGNSRLDSAAPDQALNSAQTSKMLISTASGQKHLEDQDTSDDVSENGLSSRMNRLCSILEQHGLQRLTTSDAPASGKNSLVETERVKLEKLLDTELPPVSRYQIQVVGSFPKLIAALHFLAEKLPTVSILSISLEPVDVRTRRHVWKLEVGIRG